MSLPPLMSAAALRQRAEQQLEAMPVDNRSALADGDLLKLLHELQVHQVELEMQNQALLEAQAEISRNLHQLTELYDLAPIAYFTLDRNGYITKSNALGRKLLGSPILAVDRHHLSRYVSLDSLPAYREFFERIFAMGRLEVCNLTLRATEGQPAAYVFMEGVAGESGQECRLVVTDLTRQKALEQALFSLAIQTEKLTAAREAAEPVNRGKTG